MRKHYKNVLLSKPVIIIIKNLFKCIMSDYPRNFFLAKNYALADSFIGEKVICNHRSLPEGGRRDLVRAS